MARILIGSNEPQAAPRVRINPYHNPRGYMLIIPITAPPSLIASLRACGVPFTFAI